MMHSVQLSKADSRILAQVFDPESGLAKSDVVVDPGLPSDPQFLDKAVIARLRSRERSAISLVEAFETSQDKASSARIEMYFEALTLLDAVITEYPDYASAHNNRAQLRRWRFGDRNMLCQQDGMFSHERMLAASQIKADLEVAIALSSPLGPDNAVSPNQGRLLAQAYTQLAALHYAASEDVANAHSCQDVENDQQTRKAKFEGEASRLFYLGGLYGNEVAKALAVHTNPHAKLCGNIVQEAIRKEIAQA